MTDDALLQDLRDLAQGSPSSRTWALICDKLDRQPADSLRDIYLPALNELLDATWDDALRVAPAPWLERFLAGDSIPAMGIVRTLDLRSKMLGAEDAELLSESSELATITRLNLAYNGLQDQGVSLLAKSEHLGALAWLDLAGNSIGLDGIRALCEATSLSKLNSLDLTGNWVSDDAASLIAQSALFASLDHLILRGNPIHAQGAQALSQSPHLKESIKCMWRELA
jgi:hypothetical protein